jgi:hypothetical protein
MVLGGTNVDIVCAARAAATFDAPAATAAVDRGRPPPTLPDRTNRRAHPRRRHRGYFSATAL